ncbi:fatty acid transporter [Magnaporthiopsis poae ATCC 64411]|uniref:Very long-chain fatty acid transport protein n=1 Tax=Magnaporthiopsis poae (strain ATCC 64411 / 73-15) TaxID=644358 RepID=A0A0C4DSE1_MAGP6|nr:fatty acid transporter [Magnaporthiopsis poae ATCC 64411]
MPLHLPWSLAAAAGLAYINAQAAVWYDIKMGASVLPAIARMHYKCHTGRLNFFYLLEEHAKNASSAKRTFIRFGDSSYTYAEVYTLALRYGEWMRKRYGVKKDDVVAVNFMNSDKLLFIMFGLWAIGAKPALINYNLTDRSLVHCVSAAKSAVCLVDPAVADKITDDVRQGLPGTRFEVFAPELEAEVNATEPVRLPDEVRHESQGQAAMAALIYTSGTTGLPKAAVVGWAKMAVAGGFTAGLLELKTTDVYYTCMPLYHSTAIIMGLSPVLSRGATLAIGRKFSSSNFWNDVRKCEGTIIQYVGETCRYLLATPKQYDPATGQDMDKVHKVRLAHGNGLRPDVWKMFKERFGIETIVEFYGATEGSFATYNVSKDDFSVGAVGRNGWIYGLLLSGVIAFVDVDFDTDRPWRDPKTGFCRRTKSGDPGEFLVKVPPGKDMSSRFQGYYGDAKATEAKIMRNVFAKGDAWLRTGDVMRQVDGLLFFHDRIGDTFRWKSENVSTQEVSSVLGHHDAVAEANVYGVSVPHAEGRAGCAALRMNSADQHAVPPSVLRDLYEYAARALPKFAVPVFLRLVDEMQSTGTNKQQKQELRAQGVDPAKTGGDPIFWAREGTYVPFTAEDWEKLEKGEVRL